MTWIPLGPTLVVEPRYVDYARLARANECGRQGVVLSIAVHPSDERNIVVVVRRVGGTSVFRSTDDGHSWSAIADGLTQANPQLDLSCAAVHPLLSEVIYLGARDGRRVLVSTDGGRSWPQSQQGDPGGRVTQLIVDRSSGSDWQTATLYAATDAGMACSTNGGVTWSMAPIGEITSLAVFMPSSGVRKFYAGVYGRGLYYAEAPGGPWQNLFETAPGLPSLPPPGSGMVVLVDYCPRQPDRIYALVAALGADHFAPQPAKLFVSTAPPPAGAWEERGPGNQPLLDFGLEGLAFMVAPEPAGPDTGDVLLCSGGIVPERSTDGGRTWSRAHMDRIHHVDTRSLAHHPPKTTYYADTLPLSATPPRARVYIGSDGGISASRGFTDPAFDFSASVSTSTYNGGATYDPSLGLVESLNHGLASIPAHQFVSNPDALAGGPMSMIGHLTALDTGSARRVGSTVWRALCGGDCGLIFVAPTTDGVRAWVNASTDLRWPLWNFVTWVDRDHAYYEDFDHVVTAATNSCGATSNLVPGPPGDFCGGIISLEQVSTLLSPVAPGNNVEVVPAAMTPDFVVGARVCLGDPDYGTIYQPITSVSSDRFHVTVYGSATYPAGTPVRVVRSYVARVTGTLAARISQVFIPQTRRIYRLARSDDSLLAASADQRLWLVSKASSASDSTMWTEVSARPTALSGANIDQDDIAAGEYVSGVELQGTTPLIASLTADAGGTFFVMLSSAVLVVIGGEAVNTPLFRVEGGGWVPENCSPPGNAVIPPGVALGRVVAHPTQPGRLFVARNARVFQLDRGPSEWTWTDLTDNLPGQEIHDLWIGNIAPNGAAPRFLLRAATASRGVWEIEIGAPAVTEAHLYFRDHTFDPGWLGPSADGVLSPMRAGQYHWHWQSPDIKVDTPLRDSNGALYYQNDPEAPAPTPDDFAWFKDRSVAASAGTTARIWVRVNNRSTIPSDTVKVWAITCLFSGALPSLPAEFWSRFHTDGSIDTASPLSGDWTSLGVQPVSGIHAERPGVVKFEMPTGAEGDHRCIVAFVHGPGALLDPTGLSLVVDEAVPAHPQVAQRNVLVTAPLPPTPGTPPPSSLTGETALEGVGAPEIKAYVEFNNPKPEPRMATVKFDLSGLPAPVAFEFRLSRNARPLTIAGARALSTQDGLVRWLWILLLWLLQKLAAWLRLEGPPVPGKRLPLAGLPYVARGGSEVKLSDIPLAPGGKVAAELVMRLKGKLEPGDEYHVDALQLVDGRVVGGGTILLPIARGQLRQELILEEESWKQERETSGILEAKRRRRRGWWSNT